MPPPPPAPTWDELVDTYAVQAVQDRFGVHELTFLNRAVGAMDPVTRKQASTTTRADVSAELMPIRNAARSDERRYHIPAASLSVVGKTRVDRNDQVEIIIDGRRQVWAVTDATLMCEGRLWEVILRKQASA